MTVPTAGLLIMPRTGQMAYLHTHRPVRSHSASGNAPLTIAAVKRSLIEMPKDYLGHKNIQHTVRYTELAPDRFKNFWRD